MTWSGRIERRWEFRPATRLPGRHHPAQPQDAIRWVVLGEIRAEGAAHILGFLEFDGISFFKSRKKKGLSVSSHSPCCFQAAECRGMFPKHSRLPLVHLKHRGTQHNVQ